MILDATKAESLILVLLLSVLIAPSAKAQESSDDVAGSGMAQGSGAITTRSDVTMSVESLPGTSALRIGAIGEAIGTQMNAIRACYVEVLEQRPTVEGSLQLRVRIAEDGAVTLERAQNTLGDQELTDCVLNAVRRSPFMRIRGPAGGLLVMQFQNTAAEGAGLVARERERATALVTVVDGHPRARAVTPGNEVELIVDGRHDTDESAVAALFRNAQSRIGTLLDCRRRASRRGQNPEGEIVLSLRVPPVGRASGRRVSSSVSERSAPQCVLRSLIQSAHGHAEAAGSFQITVRFSGN